MRARLASIALGAMANVVVPAAARALDAAVNDYPTIARADYVYACMQVNGQARDILEKCSCSIDMIAELLAFSEYEEAETVMSVIQRGGENVSMLHGPIFQEKIKKLKRAQVEGELRCF